MWLTVSEDPHGRIRYQYEDLYSSKRLSRLDSSLRREAKACAFFPVFDSFPSHILKKSAELMEKEEYDNVHPDSPVPHYAFSSQQCCDYSCSPGTSSSSLCEDEYRPKLSNSKRRCSRFNNRSLEYPMPSRLYSNHFLDNTMNGLKALPKFEENFDGRRSYSSYIPSSDINFHPQFAEKSRILPEDRMYYAHVHGYFDNVQNQPIVPSPDYSPPPNRVRFLDEQLHHSDYSINTRGENSTALKPFGFGWRQETLGRTNDYHIRSQLQTSASEVTLHKRCVMKNRRVKPLDNLDSRLNNLRSYGQALKDRLFSSGLLFNQVLSLVYQCVRSGTSNSAIYN